MLPLNQLNRNMRLSDGSGMPDYGFGRCDGHHEMVDFGLGEKAPLRTGLRV